MPSRRHDGRTDSRERDPYSRCVADSQNGDSELENVRIANWGARFVNRRRATGQHNTFGLLRLQLLKRNAERDDFCVDVRFPNPAADELCILSTEIDDENCFKLRRHSASL